jgi:DNA mismatch repair protein MutS2
MPLYKLIIGKPGSSYTFSIAERIGLDKKLIDRARAWWMKIISGWINC